MHQAYTPQKLDAILPARRIQRGSSDEVTQLLFDSRQVQQTEGALFFAIKGLHHNGHDFIPALYGMGVRHFVVSDLVEMEAFPQANIWMAGDTVEALQQLAAYHRQRFHLPVVGITGSNGKTIVKEWLFQLLHQDLRIVRSPKSYNSQVGVPLSVWQLEAEHELALFEAGISRAGEMEKLAPIIRCSIGIFTNIGEAHSEGFASIEEKIAEKLRLFQFAETILYCQDNSMIHRAIQAMGKPTFRWSRDTAKADLYIEQLDKEEESTLISAVYRGRPFSVRIPFSDEASRENALHCLALMLHLRIPVLHIRNRMEQLEPVAMRLEVRSGINECIIINDSYNLDLTALAAALNYLNRQSHFSRRTLILSDILQSGEPPDKLYRKAAQLIRSNGVQRLLGIGTAIPIIANYLPSEIECRFFPSTDAFLENQRHADFREEAILVKGARPFAFERIARRLARKVHQTELEVGIAALIHNIRVYQQHLREGTRSIVMVKAAAYGSGSLEVARAMEFHKIDYLAVAYADEGIELREGGVQLPILVLNPEAAVFDGIVRYGLEPEIYSPRLLHQFGQFTQSNEAPLWIHLKIDTGMHRLGFDEDSLEKALSLLMQYPQLRVRSVFSHLAASEAEEQDAFTHEQVAAFEELYERLASGLGYRPWRHILNSSGILRFPQYQMDMVRLGIGTYGIDATGLVQGQLRTALTLSARISQLKRLQPGDTVGYSRSGTVQRPSTIATISIGYADGLPRAAGNGRFEVLIRGRRAPILGNVCMDMCMVDVTSIDGVEEGDKAIIFGEQHPVQELARALNTIPYEVFTSVSPRVRRVYVHE